MERAAGGRSAQAQRGRLGRLLARARDGVPQEGLVTLLCARERARLFRVALRQERAAGMGKRKTGAGVSCRRTAKARGRGALPSS
jgi:hypothetical protein